MHIDALQAAFDARDLDGLLELMDDGVVWRGVPADEDIPICHDRREVRGTMEHYVARGGDAHPVILDDRGDSVLVEVRANLDVPRGALYQVFTFRGAKVVLIQTIGTATPRSRPWFS